MLGAMAYNRLGLPPYLRYFSPNSSTFDQPDRLRGFEHFCFLWHVGFNSGTVQAG